ncbi:MAG: hypothetical protein LUF27_02495 [Lachnospiraceae bacterium]|nr:hypothetical protein [Lachnospiraceae bacterium]
MKSFIVLGKRWRKKHVGRKLGNTDIVSVYKLRDNAKVPADYARVGIVTATWFVRPPRIVREVCEKLTLSRSQKVFIIATCGGYDGYVCIDLKAILQPKPDFPVQTFMLPMPLCEKCGAPLMPTGFCREFKVSEEVSRDSMRDKKNEEN